MAGSGEHVQPNQCSSHMTLVSKGYLIRRYELRVHRVSYRMLFGEGRGEKYSRWSGGAQLPDAKGYMHYCTTFVTAFFLMIHNTISVNVHQCKCVYFCSRRILSLVCVLYIQYQSKS